MYNGWVNYESWNVALWINNEEGLYRKMQKARPFTPASAERFCKKLFPHGTPDFADMGKSRAFKKVDWQEIADDFNTV